MWAQVSNLRSHALLFTAKKQRVLRGINEMKMLNKSVWTVLSVFILFFAGCQSVTQEKKSADKIRIVASDTILSGMSESLLPPDRFEVAVILPDRKSVV